MLSTIFIINKIIKTHGLCLVQGIQRQQPGSSAGLIRDYFNNRCFLPQKATCSQCKLQSPLVLLMKKWTWLSQKDSIFTFTITVACSEWQGIRYKTHLLGAWTPTEAPGLLLFCVSSVPDYSLPEEKTFSCFSTTPSVHQAQFWIFHLPGLLQDPNSHLIKM